MCVVSNVFDHYKELIPDITLPDYPPPKYPSVDNSSPPWPWLTGIDPEELKKVIVEFKETVAAAKLVDRVLGNPDCEDPEKVKLEGRVRELELIIENMKLRDRIRELESRCT